MGNIAICVFAAALCFVANGENGCIVSIEAPKPKIFIPFNATSWCGVETTGSLNTTVTIVRSKYADGWAVTGFNYFIVDDDPLCPSHGAPVRGTDGPSSPVIGIVNRLDEPPYTSCYPHVGLPKTGGVVTLLPKTKTLMECAKAALQSSEAIETLVFSLVDQTCYGVSDTGSVDPTRTDLLTCQLKCLPILNFTGLGGIRKYAGTFANIQLCAQQVTNEYPYFTGIEYNTTLANCYARDMMPAVWPTTGWSSCYLPAKIKKEPDCVTDTSCSNAVLITLLATFGTLAAVIFISFFIYYICFR